MTAARLECGMVARRGTLRAETGAWTGFSLRPYMCDAGVCVCVCVCRVKSFIMEASQVKGQGKRSMIIKSTILLGTPPIPCAP